MTCKGLAIICHINASEMSHLFGENLCLFHLQNNCPLWDVYAVVLLFEEGSICFGQQRALNANALRLRKIMLWEEFP